MKNIIFDLILFLIIFPYLISQNHILILFTLSITLLLICHIYILYIRYYKKKEIKWSICSEIIALFIGIIFILEGLYSKNNILILFGILILIGHIRKVMYPHLSYYY